MNSRVRLCGTDRKLKTFQFFIIKLFLYNEFFRRNQKPRKKTGRRSPTPRNSNSSNKTRRIRTPIETSSHFIVFVFVADEIRRRRYWPTKFVEIWRRNPPTKFATSFFQLPHLQFGEFFTVFIPTYTYL